MTNPATEVPTARQRRHALLPSLMLIALIPWQSSNAQTAANPVRSSVPATLAGASGQSSIDKGDPNLPIVPFEATNLVGTLVTQDGLAFPRQVAAAILAQDTPSPKFIVDVGSHQGEFLEAFLDRFPHARGQWTEPVDIAEAIAKKRLARFGNRVDYRIGCPGRDISDGCVPKTADVIITSWVSAHRDPKGVAKFYHDAAAQLPSGGWLINMDHVSIDPAWDGRIAFGKQSFHQVKEGPAPHGEHAVATLEEHFAAYRAAGIDDVQVVWRSFDTVLIMGHKR